MHHILLADGELQVRAFLDKTSTIAPEDRRSAIWLANRPISALPADVDVIHIQRRNINPLFREIDIRRRFKAEIRALIGGSKSVRLYVNGAQHFFGNFAARSAAATSVLIMDGMNSIVHRPMTPRDRRNSIGKSIIGMLAGLSYRPYAGPDVTGSRFFHESRLSLAELRREIPPYEADPTCAVIFDQGLFELMDDASERLVRGFAEQAISAGCTKVVYRPHPRVGDTRGSGWELATSITASDLSIEQTFTTYRPALLFSFFSTALFEYQGMRRMSVLPAAIRHYDQDYVNRLAAAFASDGVEVLRA